ncbi:MAG: glycoside hydrolase [Clostridiales bacterium]|nr:glycoside hydrolase [Clostridiales bacterium]
MDTLRLEDIRCRDPFFVKTAQGVVLYISHDGQEPAEYEGVDARFSQDGEHWGPLAPALKLPNLGNTYWAPEVHEYQGAWYMFVTVTGPLPGSGAETPLGKEQVRGTRIFRSEDPRGPFTPWSEGPVTPPEQLGLDGTLFVDKDGTPYMIYCHEWLQVVDGTVEAVQLSPDLKKRVGGPHLLFKASDAAWCRGQYVAEAVGIKFDCITRVTDGVFLFYDKSGALCMLWSTGNGRYETGIARSVSGSLFGPWTHAEKPLYDQDGGHAMLIENNKNELLMALHAPNYGPCERPRLIPVTITESGLALDSSRQGAF